MSRCAGVTPFADAAATVTGDPTTELPASLMVPDLAPVVAGVACTTTLQLAPTARTGPHVLPEVEKFVLSVLVMERAPEAASPVFITVQVRVADGVVVSTSPKSAPAAGAVTVRMARFFTL